MEKLSEVQCTKTLEKNGITKFKKSKKYKVLNQSESHLDLVNESGRSHVVTKGNWMEHFKIK